MRFEDIEKDMIISYDKRLFRVREYIPKQTSNNITMPSSWIMYDFDGSVALNIIEGDNYLPKISVFDINAMVSKM